MKKKYAATFKLIANIFLISFFLNTAVVVPHILTAREFSFNESINILFLTAGLGIAIFSVVSIVLFIFILLFSKMKRTKAFWLLMIIAIAASIYSDKFINAPLAKYNEQTGWIAMIAAFSVMVSLSFQYQLFLGETANGENDVAYIK
jgi:hypothetical protein